MDTLVSVGVAAAYLWSLYALAFGGAGRIGDRMTFSWLADGNGARTPPTWRSRLASPR